jgi:hypothetical protein
MSTRFRWPVRCSSGRSVVALAFTSGDHKDAAMAASSIRNASIATTANIYAHDNDAAAADAAEWIAEAMFAEGNSRIHDHTMRLTTTDTVKRDVPRETLVEIAVHHDHGVTARAKSTITRQCSVSRSMAGRFGYPRHER